MVTAKNDKNDKIRFISAIDALLWINRLIMTVTVTYIVMVMGHEGLDLHSLLILFTSFGSIGLSEEP